VTQPTTELALLPAAQTRTRADGPPGHHPAPQPGPPVPAAAASSGCHAPSAWLQAAWPAHPLGGLDAHERPRMDLLSKLVAPWADPSCRHTSAQNREPLAQAGS